MKPMKLFLIIMFILSITPPVAMAANAGLELRSESSKLAPGDETIVEVRVKDMAPVYGAEFILSFNPDVLEVVDSDAQTKGVQIAPGGFFDLSKNHFPLQNHADNSEGSVRYAVSMLNPAPEAQGDGALAKIAFRAKSLGQAGVRIDSSTFGNRDGEAVVPGLQNEWALQSVEDTGLLSRSSALIVMAGILSAMILAVIFRKTLSVQKKSVSTAASGQ